jgi:hypothetical protein
MKFVNFFLLVWCNFALLDPDPNSADQNQCGSGSIALPSLSVFLASILTFYLLTLHFAGYFRGAIPLPEHVHRGENHPGQVYHHVANSHHPHRLLLCTFLPCHLVTLSPSYTLTFLSSYLLTLHFAGYFGGKIRRYLSTSTGVRIILARSTATLPTPTTPTVSVSRLMCRS